MLNDQLLEYIRGEAAKGLRRAAISKTLVDAGWPAQDVHEALVALSVPIGDATPEPSEGPAIPAAVSSTPPVLSAAIPSPVAPAAGTIAIPAAPKPIAPIGMPAMVPNSYGVGSGKVLGVLALIKNGISIYRSRFATLISLGALQLLLSGVGITLGVWGSLSEKTALAGLGSVSPILLIAGALVGLLLTLVFVWLSMWVTLSSLHAIRGSEEKLSFTKSLQRARPQVWSFIGVNILVFASIIGALVLFVAFPAIVIGEVSTLAEPYIHQYTNFAILAVGLCSLFGGIFVMILYGARFIFTSWVYVNGEGKGSAALVQSTLLTKGRLGTVVWRSACIFILASIFEALIRALISAIFGVVSPSALHMTVGIVGLLLNAAVATLLATPILLATLYTLYGSVRNIAGIQEVSPESKKTIKMLAALGVVALIAVPLLMTVLVILKEVNLVELLQSAQHLLAG